MNQHDYCIRATAANGAIRIFVATSRHMVERARQIHLTTPVASAALGRLLTGTSIMGLMLGNDDHSLTANIRGDGPIGSLLAVADGRGYVRGYAANPDIDLPLNEDGKLNVSGAIGQGNITVMKDMGLKEPYIGNIELLNGEVAADIAYYYAQSEQTPSVVSLGVLVDLDHSIRQAGGYFIQLLPNASDSIIDKLETKVMKTPPITTMLENGLTPEAILDNLVGEFGYEIMDSHPIEFRCNCSMQRAEGALIAIGKKELNDIIEEDKKAQINCHFCNTSYDFDEEQLIKMAAAL